MKPSNTTESIPEKKKNGKAKVASAQVAPGLDSDGNLERLAKAAAACQQQQETAVKLINELVKTLSDLRSPNYHFNPSGQIMVAEVGVVEGVGEVEGVEAEVEVMVMKMVVAKAKCQLNSQQLTEVVSMINLREPLVVVMVKLGLLDSPSAFIAKIRAQTSITTGPIDVNFWAL